MWHAKLRNLSIISHRSVRPSVQSFEGFRSVREGQGAILAYILISTTLVVIMFSFIAVQALNNLSSLNLVKKSISLNAKSAGLQEELIVNYYDDPVYRQSLTDDDSQVFVSRYKPLIEGFVMHDSVYTLSLTDLDNEYRSIMKSLRYVDLFWNDDQKNASSPCDPSASFVRWGKGDMTSLVNKKSGFSTALNANLVSVTYTNPTTVDIRFSTGVTNASGGAITPSDFNYFGNGTLQSISPIQPDRYTGVLSAAATPAEQECASECRTLAAKTGSVKALGGTYLESEPVMLRKTAMPYRNRARIKDSLDYLDTSINNFSIFVSSPNLCFFALEGFDDAHKRISLPDSRMAGNVELYDQQNIRISRKRQFVENVLVWIQALLSNSLYKLY